MTKIPNYEELQKLYEQLNNKGGGAGNLGDNYLKVEEGKPIYVRILPAKNAEDLWYSKTVRHDFKLGTNFQYLQSRTIIGEECPLTNLYYSLWKEHEAFCDANGMDAKNKDLVTPYKKWARILKPKDRFFINVVDRSTEAVKILSCTEALMNKIITTMFAKEPDGSFSYGDIVDLETGHDFQILLSRGKNTFLSYAESAPSPKSKRAGTKEQVEKWMASLFDLDALVEPETEEKLLVVVKEITETIAKEVAVFSKEQVKSSRAGKLAAAMSDE